MQKQLEGFRLSPQQKHLWLLQNKFDDPQRHKEEETPYRVRFAISIEGKLDRKALKLALQKLFDRHEILRTSFHCLPGMTIPLQVIDDRYELLISEGEANPKSKIQNPKSIHINIVTISPEKYILTIDLSALIADRISIEILFQEIADLYCHVVEGKEIDDLPMQYADIAEWQNELLENPESELGRQYWQKQDFSCVRQFNLWFESNESDRLDFQPQFISLNLAINTLDLIESIAHNNRVDTSNVLLAVWQILLWQITRQSNLIIAAAVDGRKYAELERSPGLLTKYLPLHFQLEKDLTFAEVLQQANRLTTEANEWQEYFSWEGIIEPNLLPADYPIGFEYRVGVEKFDRAGVSFSICQQYACTERLKLKLTCLHQSDRLITELHYDTGVFIIEDITKLSQQFQILLDSAIANTEAAIGELEILSQSDRHQLLAEFNQTQTDYPQDKCIHQLFEEQVERSPNSIAVVFENQQLTYRELNDRSDRLANYLQELGVRAETLVAICVERSLEAIVGMLGILKAGGAYLSLDPAMPAARLNSILEDAQPALLLTQPDLVSQFSQNTTPAISLLEVGSHESEVQNFPPSFPLSLSPSPNALAYVIYTSGSTGTPKGIAVEHRQLINYLYGILERLDLPAGSSFATVSTFAADLGNTAIFPALCTGGCLHIISQDTAMDAEALAAYCDSHPIDCLKIVPSHLAALLNSQFGKSILPRKRLVLGGEVATWDLIEKVRHLAGECQIINHYGPTEATVGVLTYPVKLPDPKSTTVPIGKAIANTQIYILNEYLQPVPIGVPGEIYIGGASLARGYWQKPELTAEKFIQNPFCPHPQPLSHLSLALPYEGREKEVSFSWERGAEGGVRAGFVVAPTLYKTGDLARYLPDGNIEFLGRIDNQIKIRGFRIELGEIEAVLRQSQQVQEVVVLAREDLTPQPPSLQGKGEKSKPLSVKRNFLYPLLAGEGRVRSERGFQLVAYVVPIQGQFDLNFSDLRHFMAERIPEYMIPSAWVKLHSIPLTPNGKVDRQALPPPQIESETKYTAPRSPLEAQLVQIWAEVLGVERVGIDDNFFELGGHSLLATQIIYRLREVLQIDLSLRSLFEQPTVAGMAARIEKIRQLTAKLQPSTSEALGELEEIEL
jgi:amino acid adenylation domain-containing protein